MDGEIDGSYSWKLDCTPVFTVCVLRFSTRPSLWLNVRPYVCAVEALYLKSGTRCARSCRRVTSSSSDALRASLSAVFRSYAILIASRKVIT
jgi:hypothetical protein